MKKFITIFFLIMTLISCGDSNEMGGSEFGNPDNTGTVIVKSSIGEAEYNSSLIQYSTIEASANEVLTRTYRVSLGDSADCEAAYFEDIFDETDETNDCLAPPTDTSLFLDITGTPTLGSANITAGTYSCIRISVCDQLVWTSDTLEGCPGTNVSDIADPRGTASIQTFYYSTNGTFESSEQDEYLGVIDDPFLLTNAITVEENSTTTLMFYMTNNDAGDDIIGEYNAEADEEFQCEIPSPRMTISIE